MSVKISLPNTFSTLAEVEEAQRLLAKAAAELRKPKIVVGMVATWRETREPWSNAGYSVGHIVTSVSMDGKEIRTIQLWGKDPGKPYLFPARFPAEATLWPTVKDAVKATFLLAG